VFFAVQAFLLPDSVGDVSLDDGEDVSVVAEWTLGEVLSVIEYFQASHLVDLLGMGGVRLTGKKR